MIDRNIDINSSGHVSDLMEFLLQMFVHTDSSFKEIIISFIIIKVIIQEFIMIKVFLVTSVTSPWAELLYSPNATF
jgi:hypothetical protein